ncbi:MAG TPA: methyltransferase domain-containing protein [Stenotrophomonas sp.]|nr:methyltransferase domain-containing protein [Stenotrophomonas sp.]
MNLKAEATSRSIMQRVREEMSARRMRKMHAEADFMTGGVEGPVIWRSESCRFDEKEQYLLTDLLQYEDEEFVENAYRAILKRAPDEPNLTHYAGGLRNAAITKVEVLAALRWSPEGKACGVHIDGLLIPTTLQRWKRKPVVGPVLDWLHTLARLPRLARQQSIHGTRSAHETRRVGELLNMLAGNSIARAGLLEQRLAEFVVDASSATGELSARAQVLEAILAAEFGPDVFQAIADGTEASDMTAPRRRSLLLRLSQAEERLDGLTGDFAGLQATLQRVEEAVARLEAGHSSLVQVQAQAQVEAKAAAWARESEQAARDQQVIALRAQTDERLKFLESASIQMGDLVNSLAATPIAPAAASGSDAPSSAPAPTPSGLDALYSALEDSFRGSRELVRERVRPYLAELETASRGSPQDSLVIDIGCGRGEWLELVRNAGYQARGIDMNAMFVQTCRALDLDVVHGDAFDVLREMPSGSAAAITSMHLVEHLPFETMIALIDECRRVLRPGGLLILETPNPENLSVGAFSFYMDPTHRNPLPPGLLFWLTRSRGFAEVRIERLTHAREVVFPELLDAEQPGAESLNQIIEQFRAPLDYAVIARKLA